MQRTTILKDMFEWSVWIVELNWIEVNWSEWKHSTCRNRWDQWDQWDHRLDVFIICDEIENDRNSRFCSKVTTFSHLYGIR
jgi:hypothetical protein